VTVTPGASEIAAANAGPFPALFPNDPNGKADNPDNYPAETVTISNDIGFSTEKPGLGFAGGLLGPDNRIGIYLGDSWKPKPNITLELALRYVRDTGRTDSDLPPIPIINQYFPGEGNRVNNPNTNLAPQFGGVWDPFKKGLTVIRVGAGLYYENIIYNNVLFDRPLRLTHGAFLNVQDACFGSAAQRLATSSGSITPAAGLCGGYIGQVAPQLAAFETAFIAGNPPNLANPNGAYVGNDLTGGFDVGTESAPSGLFAPNFKTPRSLQLNIGVQQQLHRGVVLTADYVRNVETHSLLNVDLNHVGDAGYFNAAGAAAAIAATETECGATSVQGAIDNCPADVDGTGHADINDFAANGLTASWENGGSVGCPAGGCAFGGINPAIGTFYMMESIGRSVYNGLDLKLVGDIPHPFTGLRRFNTQVSYSLSRFINTGGFNAGGGTANSDQDFVISAVDNRHPLSYAGPSLLDRTSQLSFGFIADIPAKFQLSSTAHFYSGLAQTLNLQPNGNSGEIFRTDVTGDGTTQDLLPGTKIGAFGRSVSPGSLNQRINSFNSTSAGQATPAGQVLISNNLFTLPQLQAIGATIQPIADAPVGQVGMSPLKALDMKLSWVGAFWHERFSLTPSAGFYNLFNFANFDLPGPTVLNGQLQNAPGPGQTVSPGFVNSTTYTQRVTDRVGVGTGVFGLGSPRALEFGLDLNF
jgi:hypothetical protein